MDVLLQGSFGLSSSNHGLPEDFQMVQHYTGHDGRLPFCQRVYNVVRLPKSVVVIKKYMRCSLEQFIGVMLRDEQLAKRLLRTLILALERLFHQMQKTNLKHGNLKASNCFLKVDRHGDLHLLLSDPHLKLMLSEPTHDARGLADIMKLLIRGRVASAFDDCQMVEFSQYTPLLNYYYDIADSLEKVSDKARDPILQTQNYQQIVRAEMKLLSHDYSKRSLVSL